MKKISGKGNEITLCFPDGKKEKCLAAGSPQWREMVENANISIDGDGNTIDIHFNSEEEAANLLRHPGFNILICGCNNRMHIGKGLSVGHNPGWGMSGMHLVIGTPFDPWTGTPRTADNCRMVIGEHAIVCGAMIYLQDNHSSIRIGRDAMISWGVNIWCTDAHVITDRQGEPANLARFIEIGDRVWVGKDVKIGKNVKIGSDTVIGWGSVVTKSFEDSCQLIVGVPARVVKRDIKWDGRTVNEYIKAARSSAGAGAGSFPV